MPRQLNVTYDSRQEEADEVHHIPTAFTKSALRPFYSGLEAMSFKGMQLLDTLLFYFPNNF